MDANSSALTLAAKGLALLVVIFMFRYAETFTTIFSFQQIGIVPSIVAMLVLASGVGAVIGLAQGNRWGFIPLYFFIPAITLFFGYSLIPYLPHLFRPELRHIVIILLNSTVMIFAVAVLLKMMDNDVILPAEKY